MDGPLAYVIPSRCQENGEAQLHNDTVKPAGGNECRTLQC